MKTKLSKITVSVLSFVLIAAMALNLAGCKDGSSKDAGAEKISFKFSVTFEDGKEKTYTIETDKKTVGEALKDEGLIEGEESTYGLYVKTVDGVTLDYEKDGKYWAFYENGKYAAQGVDKTEITEGISYAFKAE